MSEAQRSDEQVDVRQRILAATVRCAERDGVRGFSVGDVATRAGVSRTTLYRHFPGGRPQILQEAATWEVARFWTRVVDAAAESASLEDRMVRGLVVGRRMMMRSTIFQNLMDADFQELIAAMQPSEPLIHELVRGYVRLALEQEDARGGLRAGLDLDVAADYVTRMALSWLASPGEVDLRDEEVTREIVRMQVLAGVLPPGLA